MTPAKNYENMFNFYKTYVAHCGQPSCHGGGALHR